MTRAESSPAEGTRKYQWIQKLQSTRSRDKSCAAHKVLTGSTRCQTQICVPLFHGNITHAEHVVKWLLRMLILLPPLERGDSEPQSFQAAKSQVPKACDRVRDRDDSCLLSGTSESWCHGSVPEEWGRTHSLPILSSASLHSASQEPGVIWPRVWMAGEMQWRLCKKYWASKQTTPVALLACCKWRWVVFSQPRIYWISHRGWSDLKNYEVKCHKLTWLQDLS